MLNDQVLKLRAGSVSRDSKIILENISLDLFKGECVVLQGPNGSGKTTLLLALAGEKYLKSGDLEFFGRPRKLFSNSELAKVRSVLTQTDEALDVLQVKDVLEIVGYNKSGDAQIQELVELFVPEKIRQSLIGDLSVGQRAKVFIAACVMQNSSLLLMDEPTAALDDDSTEILLNFISNSISSGKTILLATHDERLSKIANRTIQITSEKNLAIN